MLATKHRVHHSGKDSRWLRDRPPRESNQANIAERLTRIFEQLATESGGCNFLVVLWDGSRWSSGPNSRFTIVIHSPQALRAVLTHLSELRLAEAYIFGDIEIKGDLAAAISVVERILTHHHNSLEQIRLALPLLLSLPKAGHDGRPAEPVHLPGRIHSEQRDSAAIHFHYDLSNDFYATWLDKRMVYSCAYFEDKRDDLDKAQEQKLDHICRKLRLKPGERLLDVGCGWGGLIIHAAANYGVTATGITLSREQAKLAAAHIQAAGLSHRCSVEFGDYREHRVSDKYDKIASVGMFEHVGEKHLPEYFVAIYRLLRSGGVFLNHGIAAGSNTSEGRNPFLARYVFPDGELVPIHTTLGIAESAGFEVRDVESLREHYALTLDRWRSRLESQHDKARNFVDETTFRTWKLYLAGCAHAFSTRRLNLYQVLFSNSGSGWSGLPFTRKDWYCS